MISIIHPSRGRPEMAFETAQNWMRRNDGKLYEYILSIDSSDKSDYSAFYQDGLFRVVINDNKSAIEAINFAATKTCKNLLIVVSDDFDCPPRWDSLLIESLQDKEDFCVKTKDNYQKTLMTLPIMDRKYYERFGYVYYPEYKHMFCDQEMTAVAMMLGCALNLDVTFPHNHYTTGAMKKDAINRKNDLTWGQGQQLFNKRKAINFGIKNPVVKYEEIIWH